VASGRLIRKTITVATDRILNVETAQGPILASMDLVLVRLVSAMEVDSLGPVTRDEADEIRRVVLDSQHSDDLAQDNAP
jgi:membrane protein YdbS with pleckstrin-like domain